MTGDSDNEEAGAAGGAEDKQDKRDREQRREHGTIERVENEALDDAGLLPMPDATPPTGPAPAP